MSIYGPELIKRLYLAENPKIKLLHDIIRLCRDNGGTLVYKNGSYYLNYKNMCRIGRSYEELMQFKATFLGDFQ